MMFHRRKVPGWDKRHYLIYSKTVNACSKKTKEILGVVQSKRKGKLRTMKNSASKHSYEYLAQPLEFCWAINKEKIYQRRTIRLPPQAVNLASHKNKTHAKVRFETLEGKTVHKPQGLHTSARETVAAVETQQVAPLIRSATFLSCLILYSAGTAGEGGAEPDDQFPESLLI